MDLSGFTAQQAASTLTPAVMLAQIAAERPDLRPYLAMNPAAYPELLNWLGQLGDPAVDAALAHRAAQAHPDAVSTTPSPVPSSVPGWPDDPAGRWPSPLPVASRGVAPASSVEAMQASRYVGWTVGGVVLVVVLALVVGFFVWPRTPGPAPTLFPYPTKPDEAWAFNPMDLSWSDEARSIPGQSLNVSGNVFEAGPMWVVGVGYNDEYRLAGIDPQVGEVRWETQLDGWPWCRGHGDRGIVLCLVEPGPRVGNAVAQDLVALDANSGAQLHRATPGLIAEAFEMVDEDIVVAGHEEDGTRRIARYRSDGTERWTLDVTPPGAGKWDPVYSGPDIQVLGEAILIVNWLRNPSHGHRQEAWLIDRQGEVLWSALSVTLAGVDAAGRLYLNTSRDEDPVGVVALTQSGEILWERPGYRVAQPQADDKALGRLIAFNSRGELVQLDSRTGNEERVLLSGGGRGAETTGVLQVGNALVVKYAEEMVAVDLASGRQLWSRQGENHIEWVRTDGERVIVKTYGLLSALSVKDGSQVWRYVVQGDKAPLALAGKLVLRDKELSAPSEKGPLIVLDS